MLTKNIAVFSLESIIKETPAEKKAQIAKLGTEQYNLTERSTIDIKEIELHELKTILKDKEQPTVVFLYYHYAMQNYPKYEMKDPLLLGEEKMRETMSLLGSGTRYVKINMQKYRGSDLLHVLGLDSQAGEQAYPQIYFQLNKAAKPSLVKIEPEHPELTAEEITARQENLKKIISEILGQN